MFPVVVGERGFLTRDVSHCSAEMHVCNAGCVKSFSVDQYLLAKALKKLQDREINVTLYILLNSSVQVRALPKTYTINSVSIEDTINLLAALGQIRSLLSVRMGREEEKLMIRGLG